MRTPGLGFRNVPWAGILEKQKELVDRRWARCVKTASEVSSNKLRGGFYTPAPLVGVCLNRIAELSDTRTNLVVLEPSIGDGAFLKYLAVHRLAERVSAFLGLEIVESEADKCREIAHTVPFDTTIRLANTLEWAATTEECFDAVIGNPPFVRYQFVPKSHIQATEHLSRRLRLPFRGVSNLWIPILLGALHRLRPGGCMAMVVPAEIFTGLSAGDARAWLLANMTCLRIDMFEPGSFPEVLQEVVILSGRRRDTEFSLFSEPAQVEFFDHDGAGTERRFAHLIPQGTQGWTKYLLTPRQLDALVAAKRLPSVRTFGSVAKLGVSIVTGANDFFAVNAQDLEHYQLDTWAEPLLPRIRHAKGLVYTKADHVETATDGAKSWLLNFSDRHPDPLSYREASQYLALGEAQHLHTRYKTRIRKPWYRVPSVWSGALMLSKRSHWFPRLVYNAAGVVTTDTIYRGQMLPRFSGRELDLVVTFHNSLTLLSAELEGRSFGGGVLELVPSEIARLSVPFPTTVGESLHSLDRLARGMRCSASGYSGLIEETNLLLSRHVTGLTRDLLHSLEEARQFLLSRRLSRNGSGER